MPLEHIKIGWQVDPWHQCPALLCRGDRMPANLHILADKHFSTQCPCNQLTTEADAHYRQPHACCALNEADFIIDPVFRRVHTVRRAKEYQAGSRFQVTDQTISGADANQLKRDFLTLQVVTEKSRLVTGDMAKDIEWLQRVCLNK